MYAEIRGERQITIPAEIVKSLGIREGDRFEVIEKDGGYVMRPVAEIPNEVTRMTIEAANRGEDLYGPFDSVEEMMRELNA